MADANPNLIPPPSIGESKGSRPAAPKTQSRGSLLWLVVLLCVALGIGLGVFVYQQSIAPVETPRPTLAPRVPSASPVLPTAEPSPDISLPGDASPAAEVPGINEVSPQSNNIVFPKEGKVRLYFSTFDSSAPIIPNQLIKLTTNNGSSSSTVPSSIPAGRKMAMFDTGLAVTAGQSVKIAVFDRGDTSKPGVGWIKPDANKKCGAETKSNATTLIDWATSQSAGEPLVSIQCWGDWGAATDTDYNDYLVILSYTPPSAQASVVPSASPVASNSPTPSSSPVASKSPSPSPIASKSPSPAPSSPFAADSPSPSPRVTMPEASSLPDAGIFEVTVGTVSVGLLFILLGLLGLLMI